MSNIPKIIDLIVNFHPKKLSDYEEAARRLLNDYCDDLNINEAVSLTKILATQSEEEFSNVYMRSKKDYLSSQIQSIFWRLRNKKCANLKNKNPANQ